MCKRFLSHGSYLLLRAQNGAKLRVMMLLRKKIEWPLSSESYPEVKKDEADTQSQAIQKSRMDARTLAFETHAPLYRKA